MTTTDIATAGNSADVSVYDTIAEDVAPSEPIRPRLLLQATTLVSVAIVMGFAALVGHYLTERAAVLKADEVWLPEGTVIPLTQPNFMFFTMSLSLVTVAWAVQAIRNNDKANNYIATILTIIFGLSQIMQTGYLLTIMELGIESDERAPLFYGLIGAQLTLMGSAVAFLIVTGLRTLGGGYSAKDYEGVLSAAVYWVMSVAMYVLVWYAVYITK